MTRFAKYAAITSLLSLCASLSLAATGNPTHLTLGVDAFAAFALAVVVSMWRPSL